MQDDISSTRRTADRGYAVCGSGRSGSNLLCQYLSSTGLLGHPLEYFNGPGRRRLGYPAFPDAPEKQIDCILTIGATANGIYGVKVFPNHLDLIAKSVRWTQLLPNLAFVLLKRRDLLGQAISSLRAAQPDPGVDSSTTAHVAHRRFYLGFSIYQVRPLVCHYY